jgi:hypothetical protein
VDHLTIVAIAERTSSVAYSPGALCCCSLLPLSKALPPGSSWLADAWVSVQNTFRVLGEGLWRNTVNMVIKIAIAKTIADAVASVHRRARLRHAGTILSVRARSTCRVPARSRAVLNAEPCCRALPQPASVQSAALTCIPASNARSSIREPGLNV